MAEQNLAAKDKLVLNAIFNPHTPSVIEDEFAVEDSEDSLENSQLEELQQFEVDAVKYAQKGDFDGSMALFNLVIEKAPNYASGYNNRAQLFRLRGSNDEALNDLNKAIELSHGKGLSASQAYVQRALLSKLHNDTESALEDFKRAAKLGNPFAKHQLVELNPYAAMCNKMLSEVFAKELNPEVR